MADILSAAYLAKAGHFFAYLCTIHKASRTFESSAWASYDMVYERQAANWGSLDWGIVYAALYNEAFAGRAKLLSRCCYCLVDTQECVHAPVRIESVASSMTRIPDGHLSRSLIRQPGPAAPPLEPGNLPLVQFARWFMMQVLSMLLCARVHEVLTPPLSG